MNTFFRFTRIAALSFAFLAVAGISSAQTNKGITLNGTNQYVTIPDNASLDLTTSYTLEAWIKPSGFNLLGGIVDKYHTASANGYVLRLALASPYSGINFDGMETATGILTTGTWYHVAAVNDNGTRKVYVNGTEVALTGSAHIVAANTDPLRIGVDFLSSARYFNGSIDEVRVWNIARTQTQIREEMHLRQDGTETGLVGYWRFDEGSGTTVADDAGSNDGTFTNSPSWNTPAFPFGAGSSATASSFTSGTANLGTVTVTTTEDFDNAVDVVATEIDAAPNALPSTSYTIVDDEKYWLVKTYGTPGAFTADLTMSYGASTLESGDESTPSRLYLFNRSSLSEGAWTQGTQASSANVSTGATTFNGLTSFGQFMTARNTFPYPGPELTIVHQGFEGGSTWGYTGSASIASGFQQTSSMGFARIEYNGSSAWKISNATQTITFDNVDISTYLQPKFKLLFVANQTSSSDSIIIEVSTNNGSTWSREAAQVGGGLLSNGYNWYGLASVTYDGNNTPSISGSGNGGFQISFPAGVTQVRFRVTAKVTSASYRYFGIDGIALTAMPAVPTEFVITEQRGVNTYRPQQDQQFRIAFASRNGSGNNSNVQTNTGYSISLLAGSGTGILFGTTNGTLAAGTYNITHSDLYYTKAESGVRFVITQTSGDVLTADTTDEMTFLENATKLEFIGVPTSLLTNAPMETFYVEARRADDSRDSNYTTDISLERISGPDALTGTLTRGTSYGRAQFDALEFSQPGSYLLEATSIVLTPDTTETITVTSPEPTVQVTNLTAQTISSNSVTLSWVNGNGTHRLLLAKKGNTLTDTPADDAGYTSSDFLLGDKIGTSYVVANTNGSSVTIGGLMPESTYTFTAFEFYHATGVDDYLLASAPTVTVTTTAEGPINKAIYFYGGAITVQDHDSLDQSANYTLEAWIKPEEFTSLGGIISKYQQPGGNGYSLRLTLDAPYTGINFDEMETAQGLFEAGNWYHIAAVNDNGTRRVYVNGVEQPLTGTPGTVSANDNVLGIGVDYASRYFIGKIDEVRISNNVRYTSNFTPDSVNKFVADAQTMALYHFNESGGSSVVDFSGNDLNGMMIGSLSRTNRNTGVSGNANFGGGEAENGGYYFANSTPEAASAPSQPTYGWITEMTDSVDVENPTDGGNDDGYWQVALPFSFPYFGTNYSSVFIGSNGYVTFDEGSDSYDADEAMPSSTGPNTMIAYCFMDMVVLEDFSSIYYGGDGSRFVITFSKVVTYDENDQYITAQIILYPDGRIKIQYNDALSSTVRDVYLDGAIVGIEGANGESGIGYRYAGTGGPMFSSDLAVMFGQNQSALPVELVSFMATAERLNAELKWNTASEVNNFGFEIQRSVISNQFSANSQQPTPNGWSKVAFVEGNGNSNSAKAYSFTDKNLKPGKYSYRLKQIDRNGLFTYSNAVEVEVGLVPKVFKLEQNYPNPFNPSTTIGFTIQVSGWTTLKIYDILGKEVTTLANEHLEAGVYHQKRFDAKNLASGMYIAQLVSGGKMQTKKLMLMK